MKPPEGAVSAWLDIDGGAGRDIVSISPFSQPFQENQGDGRPDGRTRTHGDVRLRGLSLHRVGSLAVAAAIAASALFVTPPADAAAIAQRDAAVSGDQVRQLTPPLPEPQDPPRDANDGGYLPPPPPRRVVVPSAELGLTRDRPIPLGVTCSCTIDRTGVVSQFDLTVIDVMQDAFPMVQQLNRFNQPPRLGARYVAAYVGQQYIAGPENQAYTASEADWKATSTDARLSDVTQLMHTQVEFRPRADVYPANYVNGWLIFELPLNRPAVMVWNYNFLGERGVWFALQ